MKAKVSREEKEEASELTELNLMYRLKATIAGESHEYDGGKVQVLLKLWEWNQAGVALDSMNMGVALEHDKFRDLLAELIGRWESRSVTGDGLDALCFLEYYVRYANAYLAMVKKDRDMKEIHIPDIDTPEIKNEAPEQINREQAEFFRILIENKVGVPLSDKEIEENIDA